MRTWFLAAFEAGQLVGYLPLKLVMRKALGLPRNSRRVEYFRGLLNAGLPMRICIQVLLLMACDRPSTHATPASTCCPDSGTTRPAGRPS